MADGRHWVLDTSTKGTGAEMVPLEKTLSDPAPRARRAAARSPRRPARRDEPREPLQFRVVDSLSREVLVDRADTRTAATTLQEARSVVDVSVYVWEPRAGRWRSLTHGEKRSLRGLPTSGAAPRA